MITYSKRNAWHYAYWFIGVFVSLSSLIGYMTLFIENDNTFKSSDMAITFYSIKFVVKLFIFGVLISTLLYPTQLCKKPNYFVNKNLVNDFNTYSLLLSLCSFAVYLFTLTEISLLIYFCVNFRFQNNTIPFICEIASILYQIYLLIYRYLVKPQNFWMAMFGDRDYSNKAPIPKYISYRQTLKDRKNKNCFIAIIYYIYRIIFNPLWQIIQYLSVLGFFVVVGLGFVLGTLAFILSLIWFNTIGIFCCNKRRKQLLLNMKRYSFKFDFILFQIQLATFKFDRLYAYFVQNAPYKYKLNSILVYFFQHRYLNIFGKNNTLPNYDMVCNTYTDYHVLTDNGRTTYSRWMPPNLPSNLPNAKLVMQKLFMRQKFIKETNMNLSLFAAFYVRFFTHQFANTKPGPIGGGTKKDWLYVNEPIGLNLSTIYGSDRKNEKLVRNESRNRHLLKATIINGEEFPFICYGKDNKPFFLTPKTAIQNDRYFSKNQPDFYVIYILFFRNHNYVARSLKKEYGTKYSENRIFAMTRMINMLCIIKSTLALYGDIGVVQSTVPSNFSVYDFEHLMRNWAFRLFGPVGKLYPSNATNIPIEFNLLYRWHQLIPDSFKVHKFNNNNEKKKIIDVTTSINDHSNGHIDMKKKLLDHHSAYKEEEKQQKANFDDLTEFTLPYPNAVDYLTSKNGVENFLLSCSNSSSGKITLRNTTKILAERAVLPTIEKTRYYELASFNDYREKMGFKRYSSMSEITDDIEIINALNEVYNFDVDKVEYYVGIFAEQKLGNSLHGPFITAMFSSAVITLLTSTPLLRKDWNELLSPLGKQIVNDFTNVEQLINMHTKLSKWDVHARTN